MADTSGETESPEPDGSKQTARAAAASATEPSLKKGSGGGPWRAFGIGALLALAAVVLVLLITGGDDDGENVTIASTPTVTNPAATQVIQPPANTAPAPKPAPAAKPTSLKCDPIVGNGTPYPVASSSKGGQPAGCEEARSVLIDALNSGKPTVDGWKCKTDLDKAAGSVVATCTSGAKTITARSS
jgi:hypothetical protein